MKLPFMGSKEKSTEEKVRDKQLRQDTLSMNKLEASLAAKNNQEKDTDLLDPEQSKIRIKQQLLNLEPREIEVKKAMCSNCGNKYSKEEISQISKCQGCGNNDSDDFEITYDEEMRWVKRSEDSLVDKNGFSKIAWSEAESVINKMTAGGYLDNKQIGDLVYSSLSTITIQYSLYFWKYGVDNPSDMQQIGDILRTPMAVQASKARGGRGLKNDENTRIEKVTKALKGGDDEDDDDGIW